MTLTDVAMSLQRQLPEPAELASTSLVTNALCFGDIGSLEITPNGGVGVFNSFTLGCFSKPYK
jgi:hypothetical protein